LEKIISGVRGGYADLVSISSSNFRNNKTMELENKNINELQDEKGILLSEILELTSIKKNLDEIISIHEAKTVKDTDLDLAIEEKRKTIQDLNTEISPLENLKSSLTKECDKIQASIEEKKTLSEEIEKMKKIFKILKEEINDFSKKHDELKIKAQEKLASTEQQLESMYLEIGSILGKLK